MEDGSGIAGAESYISVADADTRHTNLGNTAWTGATSVKEAALRRATQYMLQAYRLRWSGMRVHFAQTLDWPRYDIMVDGFPVDVNSVPDAVKNACADLALKALSSDLNADLTPRVIREKVGPIETDYDRYTPQQTRFVAIDDMLAPYLDGGGPSMRLARQ